MTDSNDKDAMATAGQSARWALVAAAVAVVVGLAVWLYRGSSGVQPAHDAASLQTAPAGPAATTYVGSQACAPCHATEYAGWRKSQHAIAMQVADDKTVLGNFAGATFQRDGITTTFYRREGKFMLRTDGPDGKPGDFEVRHTFGVYPLQQYLVELPRGRLQALTIAWDSRPAGEGGQRWFDLYPGEHIDARDELHWTGRQLNWNYMCADCHSTNLRKNYDAATDTYATQWSEISVGCEACHGPGATHVELAGRAAKSGRRMDESGLTVALDERRGVAWTMDGQTGNAVRSTPRATDKEIEVCAQCHARRGQFSNDYHAGLPFADHYLPALLTAGLYYPDGQQRDEVYNWGSFLSSRMYSKGVTCSDCHEPHGGTLRMPGNQVCSQCHLASRYDVPAHHFHAAGTPGAECANCHMRTTRYMVVDPRHDHSIRIPRPDLSASIGVPNACNQCHRDRSAEWAAAEIRKRYPDPRPGFQDFAEVFADSDAGKPATIELTQLVANQDESAIARASALARLAQWPGENTQLAAEAALKDPSALVRRAAIEAYETMPPAQRQALVPLLSDPARSVRTLAARELASVPAGAWNAAAQEAFRKAADEYVAAERFNADRPEHRTNLGGFYAERGDFAAAETEYRAALRLDERFVPAWVNLADLMRLQGRNDAAEQDLRSGLAVSPDDATLHHALGLALVRQQKPAEALAELKRATELAPTDTRYAYVYGVALHSGGKVADGIAVLERALQRAPRDYDLLAALASFNAQSGNLRAARGYAERLLQFYPDDRAARAMADQLRPGTSR